MSRLEFFFDCSSPWTYLCFSRLEGVVQRTGAELVWKPVLVGGVFNAVNKEVYEARANPHPLKGRYYRKDLNDWSRFCGVKIGMPPVFPVRAVDPMRATLVALDEGRLPEFALGLFQAYWGDLEDISQSGVLAQICGKAGLDPALVARRIGEPDIKERLKANTQELMERGGFGSPTLFVNGTDMYFGNDRLPLVEAALGHE